MTAMQQSAVLAVAAQLDEERLAWLALTLAPGLGPKRILDAVKGMECAESDFATGVD